MTGTFEKDPLHITDTQRRVAEFDANSASPIIVMISSRLNKDNKESMPLLNHDNFTRQHIAAGRMRFGLVMTGREAGPAKRL